MRKLDSIIDRAAFAINSPALAVMARELVAFGLRAPNEKLDFFLSYDVRDCSQEDPLKKYVNPVLKHIEQNRDKYCVFLTSTSKISVLVPKDLIGSNYLLEIDVLAFVVDAYPSLYEVICSKSKNWKRPFYPYAFDMLDGFNGLHENHGFVDFETMSFIGREGSRLSAHSGSRSAYQPRMREGAIVYNPIETIAKACGVPSNEQVRPSCKEWRKAAELAHKYLKETFFR